MNLLFFDTDISLIGTMKDLVGTFGLAVAIIIILGFIFVPYTKKKLDLSLEKEKIEAEKESLENVKEREKIIEDNCKSCAKLESQAKSFELERQYFQEVIARLEKENADLSARLFEVEKQLLAIEDKIK